MRRGQGQDGPLTRPDRGHVTSWSGSMEAESLKMESNVMNVIAAAAALMLLWLWRVSSNLTKYTVQHTW